MILAPAMNTAMWNHPLTRLQLETIQGFSRVVKRSAASTDHRNLKMLSHSCDSNQTEDDDEEIGVVIIRPVVKTLACGEVALADLDDIVCVVKRSLELEHFVLKAEDSARNISDVSVFG